MLVLLALALAAEGGPAMLQPQVVPTHYPTADIVIASLVVAAPKDGNADASVALQAAIEAAHAAGGAVVFLPEGRYRLDHPIVVREGVTLRGDWRPPTEGPVVGTILMPAADRGNADGPTAITLERGAGIREVSAWYPDQQPEAITPYPWTISTSTEATGNNTTVLNVTLVNSYLGIRIGPEWNELHTIHNVYGTALQTGLFIDTCSDIGRLIEVDLGPHWWERSGLPNAPASGAAKAAVRDFLHREGLGVDMGRSDWEFVYRVRAAGYGTGFKIRAGAQGTTNAVMFGCDLADCGTALVLERLNGIGLAVVGCTFQATDVSVLAPPSFDSTAQFNACTFRGRPSQSVRLEGSGTLTFQNCTFPDWADTAVWAEAGTVSLLGCEFGTAQQDVTLGERVVRARILGNRFTGEPRIDVQTAGDVQVSHHDFGFAKPDISPHLAAPEPKPAGNSLVVVTDHGAGSDAADNTAAFQAALDAATGGGTVYVPAGSYRFAGNLSVPAGVELRGIFDVPHHTVSGGSVLMPLGGKGDEDGTPFIQLAAGSGLRGLTFWYPEQNLAEPIAYPWTVQAEGDQCWVVDTTIGNGWQGVDFWTHGSDGHVIRYLAGGFLKRGLFVSKSAEGWVEDIQFNPHYTARIHAGMPHPDYGDVFGQLIEYQRANLAGIVFGRCEDEHLRGTFLYAAYDGIAFRDDGGGSNARIVQHGSDTVSRAAYLEAAGAKGLEFIEAQLVPLSAHEVGAIVVDDAFKGKARFFASQFWAGHVTGVIGGTGEVLLQQLHTLTGGITLRGGTCRVEHAHFARGMDAHLTVEAGVRSASLVGNLSPQALNIANAAGDRCQGLANALSPPRRGGPEPGPVSLKAGWEPDETGLATPAVATRGGGLRTVSNHSCAPDESQTHSGKRALKLAGTADDPAYSFVYYRILDGPVAVYEDSVLNYWLRTGNDRGKATFVDLLFSDGSTLRDSPAEATQGGHARGAGGIGPVGQWQEVTVPIGRWHAGKTIEAVLLAYDSRGGGGTFEAWVDELSIDSEQGSIPWQVTATPAGGVHRGPLKVELAAPGAAGIRYTLDGTVPTADSPRYEAPLTLERPGLHDLRYAVEGPGGKVSSQVGGGLYEVAAP